VQYSMVHRKRTLRLGVSGMASSGCCAVCTMAWYTAAAGRRPKQVGGLMASSLHASPMRSACNSGGSPGR
jgi:cytochrome bd-type quinol oxidase subunit 1